MKSYKFVTADVADLVAAGSVRLTSAEQFRQSTDKPGGRGDENEMTSRGIIKGGEEKFSSEHPAFTDMFVTIIDGKRVPTEITAVGVSNALVLDALLYCVSMSDTPEIRDRMREDFQAGAVFEISDIDEFARVLSEHPELSYRSIRKGKVEYLDKVVAGSIADLSPVDPLQKDSQFSWQQEFRLIWGAKPFHRSVIDVEVPELAQLLKRLPWEPSQST